MKRIATSSFAMMLLLIFLATFAMADVNPAQMGDQGGANAAMLEEQLYQNNMGGSASIVYVPQNAYTQEVNTGSYNQYGEQGGLILLQDPNGNGENQSFNSDTIYVGPSPEYINNQQPQTTETTSTTTSGGASTLDWFNVGFDLINKNKNITIYDQKTGTTWKAKYINGKNHADIVPASSEDAKLIKSKKITGSYVRRPVVVTIAGTKYAGSMYAVGHGSKSYVSYFKGVMCIHFTGSKTHSSNKVDKDHQAAIQQALQ